MVKVTLNADPERTVTIPITTTDQDGASSADYSGVPASVTFNAGDTEVDITFTAASDSDNDDGESVKLTFGNTLPTGVSAGTTDEADRLHHGRRRALFNDGGVRFSFLLRHRGGRRGSDGDS